MLCYAMLCYAMLTIISIYFRIPMNPLVINTLITLYCHLNAFSTCQGEITDKHTRTNIKKRNNTMVIHLVGGDHNVEMRYPRFPSKFCKGKGERNSDKECGALCCV
jgi:hypothetical protein